MDNEIKILNGATDIAKVMDESLLNGDVEDDVEENGIAGDAQSASDKLMNDNFPSDRIKRKAKRLTKHLAKEASNGTGPVITAARSLKNSRKPRNGFGRGLPKKGE